MTQLKGARIKSFLSRPDPDISLVLLYGPDRGRVADRAARLVKAVLGPAPDPFVFSEIEGAQLAADFGLLADELLAIPFMGGRKTVRLRGYEKRLEKRLVALIGDQRIRESLLIIESDSLKPDSALRRICEAEPFAAAIACFEDDGRSLGELLDQEIGKYGQSISREARAQFLTQLGADRRLSLSEIEKLCLYAGKDGRIEMDDVEAICGDSAALTLDMIADCTGLGDLNGLDHHMQRALAGGIHPATILGAVMRHFTAVFEVAVGNGQGKPSRSSMARLRPPVHFKRQDKFLRQTQLWREQELRLVLRQLREGEKMTRQGVGEVATLVSRNLLSIAARAARRG